jgi:PAT family beta-lactamase induction signal transducer AmpG
MVASVGIENLCGGMGTAAFVAFLTSLCDKRFTATQYALLTSVMAIGPNIAGVPTGFMVHALGWPLFYAASALGALPGILLLPRFAPWKINEGKSVDLVYSQSPLGPSNTLLSTPPTGDVERRDQG